MTYKNIGSKAGKTKRSEMSDVHHPPTVIIQKSNAASQNSGESIKCQKRTHQYQDILGGFGLRAFDTGTMRAADVLNPLLVSVQNNNHGGAGPDDKHSRKEFGAHHQCCVE